MVAVGVGSATSVSATAFEMAWGPVRDSISTELMKRTLQAGKETADMESSSIPSQIHPTTTSLNSPAPCLRRSVAELVADTESFFSSMGSRRHGMVTGAPCLETYPLPAGCRRDAKPSGPSSYLGQE